MRKDDDKQKRSESPQSPTDNPRQAAEGCVSQLVGEARALDDKNAKGRPEDTSSPRETRPGPGEKSRVLSVGVLVDNQEPVFLEKGEVSGQAGATSSKPPTGGTTANLISVKETIQDNDAESRISSVTLPIDLRRFPPHPAATVLNTVREQEVDLDDLIEKGRPGRGGGCPSSSANNTTSLITMERAVLAKGVVSARQRGASSDEPSSPDVTTATIERTVLEKGVVSAEGGTALSTSKSPPPHDSSSSRDDHQDSIVQGPSPPPEPFQVPDHYIPGAFAEGRPANFRSPSHNETSPQPEAQQHRRERPLLPEWVTTIRAIANPVDTTSAGLDLPRAEGYDAHERQRRTKQFRNRIMAVVAMSVVIVVVLILAPILLAKQKNSTTEAADDDIVPVAQEAASDSPSEVPTSFDEYLLSLFPNQTISMIEQHPTSPQSKAFAWLLEDTTDHNPSRNLSEDRIKQRFILSTLYYATTNGDNWLTNGNWLNHDVQECDWFNKPEFGLKGPLSITYSNWLPGFSETPPSSLCGEYGLYNHLWLDQNNLVGSIPTELYMLTSLQTLSFGANEIGGTISTYIGQMTALEGISLAGMLLTGTLPTEVGLLTNLRVLMLGRNLLTGVVPAELWKLTNMMHMAFFDNRELRGTLPTEIGYFSKLRWLPLAQTSFSGTIPAEVGKMESLEVWYADGNKHSGTIPTQLGLLSNLWILHLHDNSLEGSLPTELGLLTSIKGLSLGSNKFTGPIPSQLGLLTELTISLRFKDNEFLSRTIPTELGLLSHLYELDFSNNQISGQVPSEFGQLTSMGHLSFSNNSISGTVPQELAALKDSLHGMNLEGNPSLSGAIPTDLCNISAICIRNPWDITLCNGIAYAGLSFDCTSILCGCSCSC